MMFRSLIPALLAVVPLTIGCGPKYPLHPVEGVVLMDDAPLTNATVAFHPSSGGQAASGVTDESGTYKIHDLRQDAGFGAEIGEYNVTVSWSPPPAVDLSKADSSSPDYDQQAAKGSNPTEKTANKFPMAYTIPKASKLTASVKAGPNKVDFNLSSKGPEK